MAVNVALAVTFTALLGTIFCSGMAIYHSRRAAHFTKKAREAALEIARLRAPRRAPPTGETEEGR